METTKSIIHKVKQELPSFSNSITEVGTLNKLNINTNSASAALTVTQTGSGNAFVVEDSASPDSTPFVINASGAVAMGYTSQPFFLSGVVPAVGSIGTSNTTGQFVAVNYSADTSPTWLHLAKSRGAIGAQGVVSSGDGIGNLAFSASDGTIFTPAARIAAFVDGTPGTNDMPGRLVFSTTADGASSPTERMRIDSAGNVGIGGTAAAFTKMQITGTLPSSSSYSYGYDSSGTAPSTSTLGCFLYSTTATTQAAAFTLANLTHYNAYQGAIGAGSTVTNQFGFNAGSSLTGATNNYGFYSNIASGTGRWNFYAAGTAANYFSGTVASLGSYNTTTASAANCYIDSAGLIQRSTSSSRYKTNIETLEHNAADSIMSMRPVWYRSTCAGDNSTWSWYGLIAEEVAEIDPRLVHWGYPRKEVIETIHHDKVTNTEGEEVTAAYDEETTKYEPDTNAPLQAEGVQYDRLTVLLIDVVQRMESRISELESKLITLQTV